MKASFPVCAIVLLSAALFTLSGCVIPPPLQGGGYSGHGSYDYGHHGSSHYDGGHRDYYRHGSSHYDGGHHDSDYHDDGYLD